jgi:DNA-binding response OmpR family regulator
MLGKLKILIIEDDAPTAEMAKELLADAGCEMSVAYTGKAGIELASEKKFDLITLDIGLPDVSGFEVCRNLKQRHISHRTPVVFISGRLSDEDRQRSLELGAVDYITKPFGANDFIRRILTHAKTQNGFSEVTPNAAA